MAEVQIGLKQEEKGRLRKLGFKNVVAQDKVGMELRRKLAIAHEHFRYVTSNQIAAFNEKLYQETKGNGDYKMLVFENVKDTKLVPPADVLAKMEEAQKLKCFDTFEVASIKEVHDPIVFGVIKGVAKKFYVVQWDDDVRIEDILAEHEG